jgi:hypothetical protein
MSAMKRATASLGLILCLLLSILPGRSRAQTRGPQSRAEFQRRMDEQQRQFKQKQEELQRQMQEQQLKKESVQRIRDEYSEEAHQEALGATAEQWKAIQPRWERIRRLKDMPCIDIGTYAVGASGGYQVGGFTKTSDGGHSTANASGSLSATRGVNSTSESSTRSGTAGGYGRSFAGGGSELKMQTPGPVRKQVGNVNLGWQWQRPSLRKSPDKLDEGEQACERLLDALETDKPNPEQTHQQVEGLRKARQQRQAELQQARQQLREIVTPEQEAKLILMGYLD